MGFIRRHAVFCGTEKVKLPSLVISRPVRLVCVQNTSSSDVLGRPTWEARAPQLEFLGAWRAPRNFYSGDQLWGLDALTKMLGSPKRLAPWNFPKSTALDSGLRRLASFVSCNRISFFFDLLMRSNRTNYERTTEELTILTNNRRRFNCDNRRIETHQLLITSLCSQ